MLRKIKVIHVLPDLIIGGAHLLVLDLCEMLSREGFDMSVVCVVDGGCLEGECAARGIQVRVMNRETHRFRTISWLRPSLITPLVAYFRQVRPDIVQTHLFPSAVVGKIAAKIARVPCIIDTMHNLYTWKYNDKAALLLDRALVKITNQYLCHSREVMEYSIDQLRIPRSIASCIYLGVDIKKFQKTPVNIDIKNRLGLTSESVVIGCVARLVPQKRIDIAIDVIAVVRIYIPNAVLLIVGDGPEYRNLRKQVASKNLVQNVIFAGEMRDLPPVYSLMNVFLQLADREGFGLAMMEAIACGVPVVARNLRVINEVTTGSMNPILVSEKGSEEIISAVLRIIKDASFAKQLSREGEIFVRHRYSIEKMRSEFSEFYLNAAGNACN